MKKYRKITLLEVISKTDEGDYLVQNEGNSDDIWVIPRDVFESTYEEVLT